MHIQRLPNQGISTPANLPARQQQQPPNNPQDGFKARSPQGPPKLQLAARAAAYGTVTALVVGAASHFSPFLGAAVGAVSGGLAGLGLGLQAGELLTQNAPEHGPGTTGAYGGLMVGLGCAVLGGAVGLAGGAALPFLASPNAAGVGIGVALGTSKYIVETH
jgi:hypothetical protein